MVESEHEPATLFDEYERFEQAKAFLLLGWAQQDIAEHIEVSEGTVSKYHQLMANGEAFPPSEAYQFARKYLRWLDKAGFEISEAEEILSAIDSLRTVDVVPGPDSDNLSVHEIAEIASVAAALHEEQTDKHDVATQMSNLLEITGKSPTYEDIDQISESGSQHTVRSMSEIAPMRDTTNQEARTMSEAVTQKAEMLR